MYLDINAMDVTEMGNIERFPARPDAKGAIANLARVESALEQIAQGNQLIADRAHPSTLALLEAERPHDPILCFSRQNLKEQARRFQREFAGEVTYAVKANHSARVLEVLAREEIRTFDVASLQEMQLVSAVLPGAEFHYHNPVKSRQEIAQAYDLYGVRRFAVDDMAELEKLKVICNPGETTLAIRFRLNGTAAVHDFSTKFGATTAAAADLLKAAGAAGFSCALTFHPGSQCYEPVAYARYIREASKIARKARVKLVALNVGGGFPASYENDQLPELEDYFAVIEAAVKENFGSKAPMLECEPGRAMVASCMSLLVPVKHVRQSQHEVFLQDGIYGTLMEFSQTTLRPSVTWHRAGEDTFADKTIEFQVYGPTCDPLDRLPGQYMLPVDICEGDYLEFGPMGAYSIATATRFNGYGDVRIVPVTELFSA
ncbi:MAG: type III PLP-dependent enzyme [Pseudomonadota bacterium]